MSEELEKNALEDMIHKHKKPEKLQKIEEHVANIRWFDIERSEMPYQAMFYPGDWKFKARAAMGIEVSSFSMLNPSDPLSVHEGISSILKSCVRIENGKGAVMSWKNIYEFDKTWFVLYIRNLSMPNPENKLIITNKCQYCQHDNEISLNYDNVTFVKLSDMANKYFSKEKNGFVVPTKSFGTLFIQPSNFYRAELYKNYIVDNSRNNIPFDAGFSRMYWMFMNDANQYDKNAIQNAMSEYMRIKHSNKLFSLYTTLMKELQVDADSMIKYNCTNVSCGEEVRTMITFPGGLENLFIDPNIVSELL